MSQQPIIKKKKKRNHAAHHGGSWKVAYADFVTAMMAFFLLLWLLGSTTDEQKVQLSSYFDDPVVFIESKKGGGESIIDFGGQGSSQKPSIIEEVISADESDQVANVSSDDLDELLEEREQRELNELKQSIEEAIEQTTDLNSFKDQIKLSITHEGLSIQIVDRDYRPMFDIGSSLMKDYAANVLKEIGKLLKDVPNRISISGHTDATPFSDPATGFTNWELSSERANSARRTFVEAGMDEGKVGRVIGLASSVLYDEEYPYSHVNRRISIVILNKRTADAIGLSPVLPPDLFPPIDY